MNDEFTVEELCAFKKFEESHSKILNKQDNEKKEKKVTPSKVKEEAIETPIKEDEKKEKVVAFLKKLKEKSKDFIGEISITLLSISLVVQLFFYFS